jgi:hypothetical protein
MRSSKIVGKSNALGRKILLVRVAGGGAIVLLGCQQQVLPAGLYKPRIEMRTVFSNHTWKKRSNAMPLTLLNGESGEAVAAVPSISVKVGSIVVSGSREA